MMSEEKQRPVHEIRMGTIRAAIWSNTTTNGIRHNITITRLYKDGDQWRDSYSFGRDDIPVAIKVLDRAHSWIYDNSESNSDKS